MGQILGSIYMIRNKLNGKMYVGQTLGPLKRRFTAHYAPSSKLTVDKAIRKYGRECFEIKVLARSNNVEELNRLEIEFIKKFDSVKKGYNEHLGGRNAIVGESTRKKLIASHRHQAKTVYQWTSTGEFIAKYSSSGDAFRATGIPRSNILSACNRKLGQFKTGGFVWSFTEYPDIPVGRDFGKAVEQIKDDKIIAEYVSAVVASKKTGIHRPHISSCCYGDRKTAGGYQWRFSCHK